MIPCNLGILENSPMIDYGFISICHIKQSMGFLKDFAIQYCTSIFQFLFGPGIYQKSHHSMKIQNLNELAAEAKKMD